VIKTADAFIKLVSINPKINDKSNPYKTLTLQNEWKTLQKEFDLLEAVTFIGVQRIIEWVEEQYVEEPNKDYFGYTNQTIKTLLDHLRTKWCKGGFLSGVGPLNYPCHHLRTAADQATEKMQDNQCHHL
jgi:hypothetical protein